MRRRNYCVNISQHATNFEVWKAARKVYGPFPIYDDDGDDVPSYQPHLDLMLADITAYDAWVTATGNTTVSFKKWLVWYLIYGTEDYNNLPRNKINEGVGKCSGPCPYDTKSSDGRSMNMLGFIPTKVLHEVNSVHYYMHNESRGSKWGYECTFEGCPFNISNGKAYFYI